jgi:hypothetical protein
MGIFGKKKTVDPEKEYQSAVDAEYKRMEKLRAKRNNRQEHIVECITTMRDCRTSFNQAIMTERDLAKRKQRSALPIDRERIRIREAAIGILTVDMALFDLESVRSEADLNAAMNQMGKALKQLIRLDNATPNISNSSRKFIELFYPGFRGVVAETENYTYVKKAKDKSAHGEAVDIASMYEIPEEIRNRIDSTFVENLLQGDSYEMAMFKAQHAGKIETNTAGEVTQTDALSQQQWDRINALAAEADDVDLGQDSYGRTESI